jgi:undecaprenyl-diphosphatase
MNYHLLRTVNGWTGNGPADAVMRFAARDLIFAAFAVFAALCLQRLLRRQWGAVIQAGTGLALAFALGLLAANLHAERRPFTAHPQVHQLIPHAAGQSFPSDHATAAFALAFAGLAFLSRRWGLVLLGAAALIGFARVYAGVHYPGDILGSAVVAGLAVTAVQAAAHLVARGLGPPAESATGADEITGAQAPVRRAGRGRSRR